MLNINEQTFTGRVTFIGKPHNDVRKSDGKPFTQVNVGMAITDNRGNDAGLLYFDLYNEAADKFIQADPIGLRIYLKTELRVDTVEKPGEPRRTYHNYRGTNWRFIDTKAVNDDIRSRRGNKVQNNQAAPVQQNQQFAGNQQGQYQQQAQANFGGQPQQQQFGGQAPQNQQFAGNQQGQYQQQRQDFNPNNQGFDGMDNFYGNPGF